jgi:signal transduction histidine kinase
MILNKIRANLFGENTNIISIRNSVAIVYYLYLIVIAVLQIAFSFNQPEEQIVWNFALLLIIIAVSSLFTHFKFPKQTFFTNTILVFIILVVIKFNVIYKSGFSPVQYLMVISFCITVVYAYDYRRSFVIPLLFIILDLAALAVYQELRYSSLTDRIDSNLERITYTAVSFNFYIFILSSFFSVKLSHLVKKHRDKEKRIDETKNEERESLARLENEYKKIEDAVTINSHKVRAPISRIQGLLSLHEASIGEENEDESDGSETINLQNELKKSLLELRVELEAVEQTLRNAKNEGSTSYNSLLSEDELIDPNSIDEKENDNLFS